ncbi:MAG: aminotransferase class IV [Pirellulales bacterium]
MLQKRNPANDKLIININGTLLPRGEAGVSPFDSSVQNGDAVWEGLRLYQKRVFRLHAHLDRLRKSAFALSYEGFPSDDILIREVRRTLSANSMTDGVHVRLTVSRGLKYTSGLDPRINQMGCSFFILAEHKPPVFNNSEGIGLITSSQCRPFANVLDQNIHSCNQLTSILAKIEANNAGVDDAVLLDPNGMIAETSSTHIFLVRHGCILTPTTHACPEGITRKVILEICQQHNIDCSVQDIPSAELAHADEIFVTGTMGEITPVREINSRTLDMIPGPLTAKVAQHFRDCTHNPAEGTMIVD